MISETEKLAIEVEDMSFKGWSTDIGTRVAAELRRLAALEQELEALKRGIIEAEPVAWLATGIASGLPQAVAFSSDDATDMSVNCLTQPLYTLKGIKGIK